MYGPTVFLIASVWEGIGAEDVLLALDVEPAELEDDEEALLWVLDVEIDEEITLELWLDATELEDDITELEETGAELLLETLAAFVPFLM